LLTQQNIHNTEMNFLTRFFSKSPETQDTQDSPLEGGWIGIPRQREGDRIVIPLPRERPRKQTQTQVAETDSGLSEGEQRQPWTRPLEYEDIFKTLHSELDMTIAASYSRRKTKASTRPVPAPRPVAQRPIPLPRGITVTRQATPVSPPVTPLAPPVITPVRRQHRELPLPRAQPISFREDLIKTLEARRLRV